MVESNIPRIRGTGRCGVNVAGTNDHQESLNALCGARRMQSVHIKTLARLVVRDDTISVTISGLQVGTLSRHDVEAFDRTVRYGPLSKHEVFECTALIVGGWSSETGAKDYGVRIDLNVTD